MRQGKLCDLIHVSENFQVPLESCSVTVQFGVLSQQNDDACAAESNVQKLKSQIKDDLSVKRTVLKNNKSEYFVNGMASNFTEITTLLKSKGIDLDHKRFLILQVRSLTNIITMFCRVK